MSDELTKALLNIAGGLPTPRLNLSRAEKLELIQKLGGPRTVKSIIKTKKDVPAARIPFLFSSLDTQSVVDVLANDMSDVL